MRKVIAIDFDGCICSDAYPDIGKPHRETIEKALAEKANGTALILWTCREGQQLQEAVEACKCWGLSFDAVNNNLPERVSIFGSNPRKIGADEYWDDRAVHIPATQPPQRWRTWILDRFTKSEKLEGMQK